MPTSLRCVLKASRFSVRTHRVVSLAALMGAGNPRNAFILSWVEAEAKAKNDSSPTTRPGQDFSASWCSTARWPAKDLKEIFAAGYRYWASRSGRQSRQENILRAGRI